MNIKKALHQLTIWFEQYVKEFSSTDPDAQENIDLKKEHTYRVRATIQDIGKSIDLSEEDICLAEACALLHDIGRFEQHKKYGTFLDSKSENHGALGVRILRKYKVLKNFTLATQKIIIRSVGCHNLSFIPEKNNNEWILFLKLLRDADKIDILYVVTEYYKNSVNRRNKVLELDLPDSDIISDAVYERISKGHIALLKDLRTLNDFKLYQMGWVYDLNFSRSLEIIKERRYLEMIRNSLPKSSQKAEEIFYITQAYLDGKLDSALP